MRIHRHGGASEFLARAGAWLERHEAENNLLLGSASNLLKRPAGSGADPIFATVEDGGEVVGAGLLAPPRSLVISRLPDGGLGGLVELLLSLRAVIPGVRGPSMDAAAFAERFATAAGLVRTLEMRQHIYACEMVEAVPRAAGSLRQATRADRPLLMRWIEAFRIDTGQAAAFDLAKATDDLLADERLFLWEDGDVVSMAARMGRTPHGDRISLVYTPRPCRGRGYALSCVAELTGRLLRSGLRLCFLYTDAGNATSNRIYQRIGYRRVCDWQEWAFHGAA